MLCTLGQAFLCVDMGGVGECEHLPLKTRNQNKQSACTYMYVYLIGWMDS